MLFEHPWYRQEHRQTYTVIHEPAPGTLGTIVTSFLPKVNRKTIPLNSRSWMESVG